MGVIMNNSQYVRVSLELHLFFDRIMKEHSFFLETSFTEKDKNFKKMARDFQNSFYNLLMTSVSLANGNISNDFLASEEIVTKNTLKAESISSNLSGIFIDMNATQLESKLRSGNINASQEMVRSISNLNRETLPVLNNLINFKNSVLNSVLSCKMYTGNYPLLITHIINEAKMYYSLLTSVENRVLFTKDKLYEQEKFWNNIMKEHAEFIRGLLDPSEQSLILTANKFAGEYNNIIKNYESELDNLTKVSLNETFKFRDFKIVGEEGILNCKIKSIIIPLLADHVLREANHFIRILKNFS